MIFFKEMEPLTYGEQRFVEKHMPLVLHMYKKYKPKWHDSSISNEDVLQCGYMGLMRASKTYRPGTSSYYLCQWIKSAFDYAYICHSKYYKIRHMNLKKRRVHKLLKDGRKFDDPMIVAITGSADISDFESFMSDEMSIRQVTIVDDEKVPPDDSVLLNCTIACAEKVKEELQSDDVLTEDSVDTIIISKKIIDSLDNAKITDRDRTIFKECTINDRTLDEVGKENGLTRERVRQIRNNVSEKIRNTILARPSEL